MTLKAYLPLVEISISSDAQMRPSVQKPILALGFQFGKRIFVNEQ
jgi:hypothetical protein